MAYYKVRVNVKDQHGSPVVGVKTTLTKDGSGQGYPNSFTNSSGDAFFYDVVSGTQFMYKVVAPSGYSCVECAKFHTLSTRDIWTQMLMKKDGAPNYDLHVLAKDQNNNNLQNVAITVNGAHRGYTSSAGTFSISLPGNQQYDVKGVRSGYENGFDSVYLSSSKVANLRLEDSDPFICAEGAKKNFESCYDGTHVYKSVCRDNKWIPTGDACPIEGSTDCFCEVQVTDENDNNLNCVVTIPGAEGPDSQQTGTDGVTLFQLKVNTRYTATATKDGYVDYDGFKSVTFTTPNSDKDFLALRMTRSTATCPDVDARFEATAPWRDSAQTKFAINETIEVGDTSISDREIVKTVWNWGDGSSDEGSAGFWNFISSNTFHAEHKYSTAGEKTITLTSTNECGKSDTQSFRVTILSAAEIETYITAPARNQVDVPFNVSVKNSDEGKKFYIKTKSILIDKVIGEGTVGTNGSVNIDCVIDKAGDYEIYGYDPGNTIIPGGYSTSTVDITITAGDPDDSDPDDPTEGNFKIDAPSIVISETEFTVSGIHPNAGQEIDIMAKKSLTDDIIGSGVVDSDGEFEIECMIDDFGFETIYAYDKTWLESWWLLDYIPAGWVVGNGASSNEKSVITLSWSIVIMLVLMIALVLEKQYGYIGIFKR